jgi:tripartite-type tricarboxylate transporter receptor subunit TctC
VNELEPVALLAFEPLMIVGRKSMPGADLNGLIAWLKANPGKASEGNPGIGSFGQVIGTLFQKETGTQIQSVPYRGGGPAVQDLVAGHIDLMIEPTSNFAQYIPSGAVKPYAVTAKTRVSAAPASADGRRSGIAWFLRIVLARALAAEGHAQGCHHQAQQRSSGSDHRPCGAPAARRYWTKRSAAGTADT